MTTKFFEEKLFQALSECSFYEEIKIKNKKIDENTSLINGFGIESIQLLEYIIKIEKCLNTTIDFDELSIESFDTISGLAKDLVRLGTLI